MQIFIVYETTDNKYLIHDAFRDKERAYQFAVKLQYPDTHILSGPSWEEIFERMKKRKIIINVEEKTLF
jgi:hypothetical protein